MIFLMLTILKSSAKNRLALKTQTSHHAYICFLRIVQDTSKIQPQLKHSHVGCYSAKNVLQKAKAENNSIQKL